MTDLDVLVVGGGPAGLTAARATARAGRSTMLVEAGDRPGGMAASIIVGGQSVDLGSHRLHPTADERVMNLLSDLLGDDLQVRSRNGRLRLGDRWLNFPLSAADLVANSPRRFALASARDLATARLREPAADTYAEVVGAGLGPAAYEAFHRPMAAKLWGVDPSLLSGELARKRVPVRSAGSLVSRLASSVRADRPTYLYPRLGYGQIVDSLVADGRRAGVDLRCSTRVVAIGAPDRSGGPVSVTLAGSGGAEELKVGRVLWTAGPERLASAHTAGTGEVVPVPAMAHRGLVLVYLVLDRRPYTPFDAHYVADPDVPFSRVSEPANYRDGPDPAYSTVLCVEIPASVGDRWWRIEPVVAARVVADALTTIGLPRPSVVGVEIRRLPRVYPLLLASDAGARSRLLDALAEVEGVSLVGRQARLVADNLHHVVAMALSAADCVGPGGAWDADRWAEAERRFETFVVED